MNLNLNSLLNIWRKFWFEPTDTLTVCVFRVCYGILVLQICLIHLGDHFKDWYGPRAIVDINTVIAHFWYN